MKTLILAVLVAVAGAVYYFDGLSYIIPQDPREKALYERARILHPGDEEAQKRWVKAEIATDKALSEFTAGGDARVIRICSRAKFLYPDDPLKRLDYAGAQIGALDAIDALGSGDTLSEKEKLLLLNTVKANYPNDLLKASGYAADVADYFARAKEFRDVLPKADFNALYGTFLKNFAKSPSDAYMAFERSATARARFISRRLSPELDGIREFISSQSSDPQTQDSYLDNVVQNGYIKLPPNLWNKYPSSKAKFGEGFNPQLRDIMEKSLYYVDALGVKRGALYVFDGRSKYFIISSNAVTGNFSDVRLSGNGEDIKCRVVEISNALPVAKLLPVDAWAEPKGKPVVVSAIRTGGASLRLLGENCFGRAVTKDVAAKSLGELFFNFYTSDNIPLYSEASLVLDPQNNFAVAMKLEDRSIAFRNRKLMSAYELNRIASFSKNKLSNYQAMADAYFNLVSVPNVVPAMGFAALDKILFSMENFDAATADKFVGQLEDFTKKNNLLAKLIATNRFASYSSDETAEIFPELAKLTRARKDFIEASLKRGGRNFTRAYFAWLVAARDVISKDFYNFRDTRFPNFLRDEVKIQEEFRNMLMKFFPASLPYPRTADELRRFLPEDLADPLINVLLRGRMP